MAKKIAMQKGYPTSDDKMHSTHKEAVKHQTDLDLCEAVDNCGYIDTGTIPMKDFLKEHTEVVKDYIAKHLTAPAVKKPKAVKPNNDGKKKAA